MANGGKASDSPNILLILNDDMGFSDIGCYGGEIDTAPVDIGNPNMPPRSSSKHSGRVEKGPAEVCALQTCPV